MSDHVKAKEIDCRDLMCIEDPTIGELGGGAQSVVRWALHSVRGPVAVKCFSVTGGPPDRSRLEKKITRELQLLHEAAHECIVIYHGWVKWPKAMGLVMEYLPVGSIRQFTQNSSVKLSPKVILRMASEISSAVAYMHNLPGDKHVVHGDLKPDNVMLTRDLHCKVGDFGSAEWIALTGCVTLTGPKPLEMDLTLAYAPPEKLRKPNIRIRKEQDTYSFGMLLYVLLTGSTPYQYRSQEVVFLESIKRGERPDTEEIDELKETLCLEDRDIVSDLESIMKKCWQQDPSDRPRMLEVRDQLRKLLAQQTVAEVLTEVAEILKVITVSAPIAEDHRLVPLHLFSPITGTFAQDGVVYNIYNLPNVQQAAINCDVVTFEESASDRDNVNASDGHEIHGSSKEGGNAASTTHFAQKDVGEVDVSVGLASGSSIEGKVSSPGSRGGTSEKPSTSAGRGNVNASDGHETGLSKETATATSRKQFSPKDVGEVDVTFGHASGSSIEGKVSSPGSRGGTSEKPSTSAGHPGCSEESFSSQSVGRAIQVLRSERNGSFSVDHDQLELVFGQENVADSSVAAYSIVGDPRKGKSFMMNFFLHFLKAAKKGKSDSWLQNKAEELSTGFTWRVESERRSPGIWIWSEPFIIITPDQSLVAVFLMYTQVASDLRNMDVNSSVIFALSTLISSVQIYNVKQPIREDSLKQLQHCIERGMAAQKKMQQPAGRLQRKTFQDLLFLVRDWSDPDTEYGFSGAAYVLSKVLEDQQTHKDMGSVMQNIQECFENVKCFLIPSPGQAVALRDAQAPPLVLQDMDSEFLKYVDVLARGIFSPENLVVKKVNESVLTGKDLINSIMAYWEMLQNIQMPKIGAITKESAKDAVLRVMKESQDRYNKYINERTKEGYIESTMLTDLHEQSKAKALALYDEHQELGDDSLISTHKKKLAELIDQQFALHDKENASRRERMLLEIQNHMNDVVSNFGANLEEFSNGEYVEAEGLAAQIQEYENTAVKRFEERTQNFDQRLVGEYKKEFNELKLKASTKFEKVNHDRQVDMIHGLEDKFEQAQRKYVASMDEVCEDRFFEDEEFAKIHDNSMATALRMFDTINIGRGTKQRGLQRQKLEDAISREKGRYRNSNRSNKKLEEFEIFKTIKEAEDCYKKSMEEQCGSDYTDPDELEQAHVRSKQKAEALVASLEEKQGKTCADKCRSQLDFHERFQNLKANNEDLKRRARVEFEWRKNDAFLSYKTQIDERSQTLEEEDEIRRANECLRTAALEKYCGGCQKPQKDFDEFQQRLTEEIKNYYMSLIRKIVDKKKSSTPEHSKKKQPRPNPHTSGLSSHEQGVPRSVASDTIREGTSAEKSPDLRIEASSLDNSEDWSRKRGQRHDDLKLQETDAELPSQQSYSSSSGPNPEQHPTCDSKYKYLEKTVGALSLKLENLKVSQKTGGLHSTYGQNYDIYEKNLISDRETSKVYTTKGSVDDKFYAAKHITSSGKAFEREIKLMCSLCHPNVLRYYNCTKNKYIIMELCVATVDQYINGGQQKCISLEDGTRPEKDIRKYLNIKPLDILQQSVDGIAYLHSVEQKPKILHRDIKPSNFLLTKKGTNVMVKVSDFGLSKEVARDQSTISSAPGYAIYLPPESHAKKTFYKASSDVFSLGVYAAVVLTLGEHPFGGDELPRHKVIGNICDEKPDLNGLKKRDFEHLTEEQRLTAANMISKMLGKEPKKRIGIKAVKAHPLFWSAEKKVKFYKDVYQQIVGKPKKIPDSDLSLIVEEEPIPEKDRHANLNWFDASLVDDDQDGWELPISLQNIPDQCIPEKEKPQPKANQSRSANEQPRRIKFNKDKPVESLLKVIRDKQSHLTHLTDDEKKALGYRKPCDHIASCSCALEAHPNEFLYAFTKDVPQLLVHLYNKLERYDIADLKEYYPPQSDRSVVPECDSHETGNDSRDLQKGKSKTIRVEEDQAASQKNGSVAPESDSNELGNDNNICKESQTVPSCSEQAGDSSINTKPQDT